MLELKSVKMCPTCDAGGTILQGSFRRDTGDGLTVYYSSATGDMVVYSKPVEDGGIRLHREAPGLFRYDGKVVTERDYNIMLEKMKGAHIYGKEEY